MIRDTIRDAKIRNIKIRKIKTEINNKLFTYNGT